MTLETYSSVDDDLESAKKTSCEMHGDVKEVFQQIQQSAEYKEHRNTVQQFEASYCERTQIYAQSGIPEGEWVIFENNFLEILTGGTVSLHFVPGIQEAIQLEVYNRVSREILGHGDWPLEYITPAHLQNRNLQGVEVIVHPLYELLRADFDEELWKSSEAHLRDQEKTKYVFNAFWKVKNSNRLKTRLPLHYQSFLSTF